MSSPFDLPLFFFFGLDGTHHGDKGKTVQTVLFKEGCVLNTVKKLRIKVKRDFVLTASYGPFTNGEAKYFYQCVYRTSGADSRVKNSPFAAEAFLKCHVTGVDEALAKYNGTALIDEPKIKVQFRVDESGSFVPEAATITFEISEAEEASSGGFFGTLFPFF